MLSLCALSLALTTTFLAFYVVGWMAGDATGSGHSVAIAISDSCLKSAHQVNWAQNVVNDRVKSRQITQALANEVMSAEIANYAYSCGPWPYPPGDLYMPGVTPILIPLSKKPTLPIANPPVHPACPLTASHCSARGY
jgi:hypothetical protein